MYTKQKISTRVNRDGAVENGARRRGPLHRARKPSRKWNLRGLPSGREQQKKADNHRLGAGEPRKAVSERGCSGPMMHSEDADQQSNVAGTIDREDAKTVFNRGRPLLEERDQQHRSNAHNLPSGDQQVERAGRKCDQRPEREEMQEKKKPEETVLAMKVGRRELADQP